MNFIIDLVSTFDSFTIDDWLILLLVCVSKFYMHMKEEVDWPNIVKKIK
jgi:hypothetical protein